MLHLLLQPRQRFAELDADEYDDGEAGGSGGEEEEGKGVGCEDDGDGLGRRSKSGERRASG